jgi:hypothetical protein
VQEVSRWNLLIQYIQKEKEDIFIIDVGLVAKGNNEGNKTRDTSAIQNGTMVRVWIKQCMRFNGITSIQFLKVSILTTVDCRNKRDKVCPLQQH